MQRQDIACETPAFKDLSDCLADAEDAAEVDECHSLYRDDMGLTEGATRQRADFSCDTLAFKDLSDCLAAAEGPDAVEGCMAQYEENEKAEQGVS